MKKTFSINIANTLFNIEEDAYQALEVYLAAVKAHFADNEDKDEILKDIETRIAERFSETPGKIITLSDVEHVTKDMGSVNQFDDEEHAHTTDSTGGKKKQLYRDTDNAIIAGVASGLSHYLGIEVSIVRVLFALSVLLGGAGILAYLVLWFVVPEAQTSAQKLEMRGDPVNLSTVSNFVKEKFEEVGKRASQKNYGKNVSNAAVSVSRGFANLIQKVLFPAIRILFGSIFVLSGFMFAVGTTIMLGVLIFNLPMAFVSVPVAGLFQGSLFYLAVVAVYFSVLIPAILIFFFGLRVMHRKRHIGRMVTLALLGIWLAALITSGVAVSRVAMRADREMATNPMYIDMTEDRTLEQFSKISVQDFIHVTYVQGDTYSAAISANQYNIDRLEMNVVDDTLMIGRTNERPGCFIFCINRNISIVVTSPNVTEITVRDASRVEGDIMTAGNLTLTVRDASALKMGITAESLTATVRDASIMTLTGSVATQEVKASDASRYDGRDLTSEDAIVSVSDASRADILATQTLKATARDAAAVRYYGDPMVTKDVSDASSVKHVQQTSIEEDLYN